MNDVVNFKVNIITPEQVDERLTERVNELLLQLWDGRRMQTVAGLREYVSKEHIYQFGALVADELVGLATLVVVEKIELTAGQLEGVVVDEKYRRRGIGRALSRAAIEQGRRLGLLHLELTSRPSRIAAHRLYRSLGFKRRQTVVYRLSFV